MKCEIAYSQMKRAVSEYHEMASRNLIPAKWCVVGIEEWLKDFESQIPRLTENESARNIMSEDLEYERKKLVLLKVHNIVGNVSNENKMVVEKTQ